MRGRCGCGDCVYGWYTWFRCLASAGDVLEISMVRGVGGVCGSGRVGRCWGEWVTGLGLGFTNSGGTWGKWDMCLCFGCGGVGGVRGEWVGGLG